jgi:hypothetical protein
MRSLSPSSSTSLPLNRKRLSHQYRPDWPLLKLRNETSGAAATTLLKNMIDGAPAKRWFGIIYSEITACCSRFKEPPAQ